MAKHTRAKLKKDFFGGLIDKQSFKSGLELAMRYRGYHSKPGHKPMWSGPFRGSMPEADQDNVPYANLGYDVDVYQEQA